MSEGKLNIVNELSPQHFWDTDIKKLDANHSRRLVIERVFSLGTVEEIRRIIDYYGKPGVVEVLTSLNYLDPKTLHFVALLFSIPLSSFKCYKRKRSNPTRWNS